MSISCDIATDLMSLYQDGCASADTRAAIREHLKQCPSCAKLYHAQYMKKMIPTKSAVTPTNTDKLSEHYKHIAKRMRHRQRYQIFIIIAIISSIFVCFFRKSF